MLRSLLAMHEGVVSELVAGRREGSARNPAPPDPPYATFVLALPAPPPLISESTPLFAMLVMRDAIAFGVEDTRGRRDSRPTRSREPIRTSDRARELSGQGGAPRRTPYPALV